MKISTKQMHKKLTVGYYMETFPAVTPKETVRLLSRHRHLHNWSNKPQTGGKDLLVDLTPVGSEDTKIMSLNTLMECLQHDPDLAHIEGTKLCIS